jgi:hypothetical protein
MTKIQSRKEMARLQALLATQEAAKLAADRSGDADYFYAMCDAVSAALLQIEDLQRPRAKVDGISRALVSANID